MSGGQGARVAPDPLLRMLRLAGPLRGRLLVAAGAGALATGCGVALLATSGFLLARASQHPDISALSVAIVAVRGLSIGRGGFRYAERLASHDVAFRVLARVRVAIWRRLEALAPAGLPDFRSGDLLARLVSDVDATQDLFIRGIAPPRAAAAVGAAAVLVCVTVLVPAGLLLAAGLAAGGIAVPLAGLAAARVSSRCAAPARGQFGAGVRELLAGAAELTAFGAQEAALARVEAAQDEVSRLARRSAAAAALGSGLAALVAGLTLWGVLLLGVQAVGSGAFGRVPLAVLTLTALASFEAVTVLPAAALALSEARTSAGRIAEVLDAPDPVSEPDRPRPLPAATAGPWPAGPWQADPTRAGGALPGPRAHPDRYRTAPPALAVRLRDASVRYRAGGPLALDRVSLDLPPGRRVALVGPNGAGKSTVAAVLLRFVELAGGTATLDGHDLAGYRSADVRAVIGGCPQDPHLFDATIAENLRIARPAATDGDLLGVLAAVGLRDWIAGLPLGLDTQAGQNGAAVSGGQRQRIALGRALLADPAVLVLDEPTAHLDAPARRSLMADLLAVTAGRATLLITHDLDGLDQFDEIVVLDQGRVAGRGTHAGLLLTSPVYQSLWQSAQPAARSRDQAVACQGAPDVCKVSPD